MVRPRPVAGRFEDGAGLSRVRHPALPSLPRADGRIFTYVRTLTPTAPSALLAFLLLQRGSLVITRNAQPLRDGEPVRSLFTYAKGESLYRQDDCANCWFEVVSGIIRACRLYPDGRRQVMGFFHAGDAFGVDHDFYQASAEVVTDVATVRRHMSCDHAADDLALQRALKSAEDCIFLLGHRTATQRLAAFLLAFADRTGAIGRLALPMSRCDIADYLGLTIETVSRTISELVRRRLIALDAPQLVRLLDAEKLRTLAGDADSDRHPMRIPLTDLHRREPSYPRYPADSQDR